MENNLIVIKQLPVIEDQLQAVKKSIEERVELALSLVCTEETYKDIKKVRSELNKEYQELEKRRKEVKNQILKPYESFEGIYKECAGDLYARADNQLRQKINEVEDGLRKQKEEDLAKYFAEYRESLHIAEDFVSLDKAGIKIGLSDSKTALRKKASEFLDRIASDLQVIETLESGAEVMAEYRKTYNLSGSMLIVDERHKAIEAEKARREAALAAMEARNAEEAAAAAAIREAIQQEAPPEAVSAPVQMPDPETAVSQEPIYSTTFKVTANLEKLRALKNFLTDGGYDYEQL